MNNRIGKMVYLAAQFVNGEPVTSLLSELEQTQWHSIDKLQEMQWEKLKRLIEHAYNNVPFYKKRFADLRIVPDDIKSEDDFRKIPLLNKDDIRENKGSLISGTFQESYITAATSGSTGQPLFIKRGKTSWGYNHANSFRALKWYGIEIGEKWARVSGTNVVFTKKIFENLKNIIFNRVKLVTVDLTPDVCENFFYRMLKFKPSYIYGYPSAVYYFATSLKQRGIEGRKLDLKIVMCSGETLIESHRMFIEDYFKCRVVNDYASSEVGTIAIECPQGSMHIPIESIFVETMPTSDSGSKGGEIIVTDLHSYVMPIIRYQLGDLGEMEDKQCACGRGLPVMRVPRGRISSMIETPDGKFIHSIIFDYLLEEIASRGSEIFQYQIVQERKENFTVNIVGTIEKNQLDFLKRKLKKILGDNAIFHFNFVSNINRQNTGKFTNFIRL